MSEILPGSRVLVFDPLLYRDDVSTPLSHTMRPATVLQRYGYRYTPPWGDEPWIYDDVIDVRFDHRPDRISRGHFTKRVKAMGATE